MENEKGIVKLTRKQLYDAGSWYVGCLKNDTACGDSVPFEQHPK